MGIKRGRKVTRSMRTGTEIVHVFLVELTGTNCICFHV